MNPSSLSHDSAIINLITTPHRRLVRADADDVQLTAAVSRFVVGDPANIFAPRYYASSLDAVAPLFGTREHTITHRLTPAGKPRFCVTLFNGPLGDNHQACAERLSRAMCLVLLKDCGKVALIEPDRATTF